MSTTSWGHLTINGTADLVPTKQHSASPKWDTGPATTPEQHPTKLQLTLPRPHGTKCAPQPSPEMMAMGSGYTIIRNAYQAEEETEKCWSMYIHCKSIRKIEAVWLWPRLLPGDLLPPQLLPDHLLPARPHCCGSSCGSSCCRPPAARPPAAAPPAVAPAVVQLLPPHLLPDHLLPPHLLWLLLWLQLLPPHLLPDHLLQDHLLPPQLLCVQLLPSLLLWLQLLPPLLLWLQLLQAYLLPDHLLPSHLLPDPLLPPHLLPDPLLPPREEAQDFSNKMLHLVHQRYDNAGSAHQPHLPAEVPSGAQRLFPRCTIISNTCYQVEEELENCWSILYLLQGIKGDLGQADFQTFQPTFLKTHSEPPPSDTMVNSCCGSVCSDQGCGQGCCQETCCRPSCCQTTCCRPSCCVSSCCRPSCCGSSCCPPQLLPDHLLPPHLLWLQLWFQLLPPLLLPDHLLPPHLLWLQLLQAYLLHL
ncbi:hypothetical protein QTO34_008860 [Cnephaeus nilssonii]|uniref:Uncharacterized protein n=1 Tax=Cnephaeus nilssonii TaxID=3371016 RepID=A0AA40HGT3_CNENI|nr:hypothetical protein QTO34_008860 [Eptesicus nilssonii]